MKLIIKNLKQVPHNVEVENEKVTIKDLKLEIEKEHGFDANHLKLLFNGVVLDDTKTLESYGIKDEYVIIMMNTKAKPKNTSNEQQTEQTNPQTTNTSNTNETKTEQNPNPQPSQQQPQPQQQNYTEQINNLVDMGFVRTEAEAAIKAARGDTNLAIEFLYSGIPANLPPEIPQSQPTSSSSSEALQRVASAIKIICTQNPNALQTILMNIEQTNPQLMNNIKEHEEEFKNLLQSPVTQADIQNFQQIQSSLGGLGGGLNFGGGQRQRPQGGLQIPLSKEEFEAVKRLKELGNFSDIEAVQAYMACEKNEELAANFLLESKMNEGFEDQMFGQNNYSQPQQPVQPQPQQQQQSQEPKPEEKKDEPKPEEKKDEPKPEEKKEEPKPEEKKEEPKPEEKKDEPKPEEKKDEPKPEEK